MNYEDAQVTDVFIAIHRQQLSETNALIESIKAQRHDLAKALIRFYPNLEIPTDPTLDQDILKELTQIRRQSLEPVVRSLWGRTKGWMMDWWYSPRGYTWKSMISWIYS